MKRMTTNEKEDYDGDVEEDDCREEEGIYD
jgi:hypothetical protein